MVPANKILTVTYGTFSCTLEGFEDPFSAMTEIAEYFRSLAERDRFFGAEPPTPDLATLQRIAASGSKGPVQAAESGGRLVLRPASTEPAEPADAQDAPEAAAAPGATEVAEVEPERAIEDGAMGSEPDSSEPEETPAPEAPESAVAPRVAAAPALAALVTPPAAFPTAAAQDDSPVVDDAGPIDAPEIETAEAQSAPDDASGFAADEAAPEPSTEAVAREVAAADDSDPIEEPAPIEADEAPAEPISEAEDVVSDAEEAILDIVAMPSDDGATLVLAVEEQTVEDLTAERADEAPTVEADAFGEAAGAESDEADADAAHPEATTEEPDLVDEAAEPVAEANAVPALPEDVLASLEPTEDASLDLEVDDAPEGDLAADLAALFSKPADPELDDPDAADATVAQDETAFDPTPAMADAVAPAPQDEPEPEAVDQATPEPEDARLPQPVDALPEPTQDEPAPEAASVPADAPAPAEEADESDDLIDQLAAIEAELNATRPHAEPVDPLTRDLAAIRSPEPASDEADATADATEAEAQPAAGPDAPEAEAAEADAPAPESQKSDLERLFAATDSRLAGDVSQQKQANIAHLKAAVRARKADETIGIPEETDVSDAYREDLAQTVKPQRLVDRRDESAPQRAVAAPLVLVSEQRVAEPPAAPDPAPEPVEAPAASAASRPASAAPEKPRAADTAEDFEQFAEEVGAIDLTEVLEAAAVYSITVMGQESFSRPRLLHLAAEAVDDLSREDGLRGFGQLLREGTLRKVGRGTFTLGTPSRFQASAERRAG